jgi:hypothetical protein
MERAVRTRSGVEFYAEGWPEGIGPTAGVAKRNPSRQKPGRPAGGNIVVRAEPSKKRRRSLKTARDHLLRDRMLNAVAMIVLRARMKTYETRGCSRESAVLAAMADFDWPNRDKIGEVKRVLLDMRRLDKAERAKLKPSAATP